MTLEDAFAQSSNLAAVRVSHAAGQDAVARAARDPRVTTPMVVVPSLPLDPSEVSLVELAGACATPIRAAGLQGGDAAHLPPRMDWDPEQAPLLQILRAAVERGAEGAAALPILVTARPEGARDSATRSSWASPGDLVPGVWFGNDDASPMRTTSRGAPPPGVWRNFMQSAFADEIAAAHEIAAAQGPSEPAFLLDAA